MAARGAASISGDKKFRHKRGTGHIYFLFPLFWLLLSAVGLIAFVDVQVHKAERTFDDRATAIGGHFVDLSHGVMSVLEGFSAMLEAMNRDDAEDRVMVARYASQMRAIYPQVYMLEEIDRIPREQVPAYQQKESRLLNKPFIVRSFGYGHSHDWVPLQDRPDYYVVALQEPSVTGYSDVLGLEIDSSNEQHVALREALRTGREVTSAPYKSVSGLLAFMMIRPLEPDKTRFAKLEININTFKDMSWLQDQGDVDITIHHADFQESDPSGQILHYVGVPASALESLLLPEFRWQKDMRGNGDQAFIINVSKQMRWQELDIPAFIIISLVQLAVLLILIKLAVEQYSHEAERKEHEVRLVYMASHDSLTGLPNRSLLMDRLEQMILRAKRDASQFSILFLDIDRFKAVNDNYGHDFGDLFLMTTAETIRESVRAQDTVARLSGDEFVVLLERAELPAEVGRIADKIKHQLQSTICKGYRDLGVGISIGYAIYPEDGLDANSLLRHADTHMYGVKRGSVPSTLML